MQTYSEYFPTPVDPKGAHLIDRADWLVAPIGRNRDSDELAASNFEVGMAMLGGEGPDVEIHRFRHWGPGWVEMVIVRPETRAAADAARIEDLIANYPALDDQDLSSRENDRYVENWNDWGKRCFVGMLVSKFNLSDDNEDALAAASDDDVRKLYEAHVQEKAVECSPDLEPAIADIVEDDVHDFLADHPLLKPTDDVTPDGP